MLFLFLLFSQLMAMDADTPTTQKPYDSPINTKSKRLHSALEDADFKFLLDECETYKLELKESISDTILAANYYILYLIYLYE